jgi:hypothetical protein
MASDTLVEKSCKTKIFPICKDRFIVPRSNKCLGKGTSLANRSFYFFIVVLGGSRLSHLKILTMYQMCHTCLSCNVNTLSHTCHFFVVKTFKIHSVFWTTQLTKVVYIYGTSQTHQVRIITPFRYQKTGAKISRLDDHK